MTPLEQQGAAAKAASYVLASAGTERKNEALEAIAKVLTERKKEWLEANAQDLEAARTAGMRPAMLDRLTLTEGRIAGIVEGVRQVASLPDPIGRVDLMYSPGGQGGYPLQPEGSGVDAGGPGRRGPAGGLRIPGTGYLPGNSQ